MSWEGQSLPGFVEAHRRASEFVIANTDYGRILTPEEGLVLQAAGHILLDSYVFTEPGILELTGSLIHHGGVNGIVRRFVRYDFLVPKEPMVGPKGGRPRHTYTDTELGGEIIDFFLR